MTSRSLDDLHPTLAIRAQHLLNRAFVGNIPVVVTATLRTWPEQDALYAQGRTAPGPRVTNARGGESWHNFGRAFDVAFVVDGRPTWDGPWERLGMLGEALGLEWGGRWSHPDRPHFQFTEGMTLSEARALLPRRVNL